MQATHGTLAPPAAPWSAIRKQDGSGAYLSVYLSSSLARLPIRDVTRLRDNKSDPNLETKTYGLFSTCEQRMRQSIAKRGIDEIFFITNVEGEGRALVGRYKLGWLVELEPGDVALAASAMRFVEPIPVATIPGRAGDKTRTRIRGYMRVDTHVANDLRQLVDASPDRTDRYLAEIARLERMSSARTGYTYPSWDKKTPFTWPDAGPVLAGGGHAVTSTNVSSSGVWVCAHCSARINNEARLRVCNVCHRRGTLKPEDAE